jgi:putative peptidoglycan lipid II flippase
VLPDTWRPVRVGVSMIGWVVAYALISQIGVVVVLRVAFINGGVSVYTYADLLFQVPYGILGVSLLTVLMPRIARAVARADTPAILADLGRGARYSIVALIPVTAAVSILAPAMAKVMFLGRVDVAGAELIGATAAAAAFGLAPFALVMLQVRVFYAGNDARTPALINLAMVATKVAATLIAAATLSAHAVVIMLGVASSLSYLVGATLAHFLLRQRYGLLGFHQVAATLRRVGAAAAVAGGCCLATVVTANAVVSEPRLAALLGLGVGTAVGLTTFLLAAKAIGIPELRNARALLIA